MEAGLVHIEALKSQIDALDLLVKQIQKDFHPIELNFELSDQPKAAFESLQTQFAEQLAPLLNAGDTDLFNALYRVDLPEQKLNELLFEGQTANVAMHLVALVLERELIKVAYRKLHS